MMDTYFQAVMIAIIAMELEILMKILILKIVLNVVMIVIYQMPVPTLAVLLSKELENYLSVMVESIEQ